jgi:hypothetical protein
LSWKRRFDDAIVLPDGRMLVTLLDAATYATKLSKKEAARQNGKPRLRVWCWARNTSARRMFAGIGIVRALNRQVR